MPANPYACSHMNAAYARLVAAVQEIEPPAFTIFPTSDQYAEAVKMIKDKLAPVMDDFLYALVTDAAPHSVTHISTRDRLTLFTDMINDSGIASDLQDEADRLEEEERDGSRSDYAEHNTMHRTYQGV